MGWYGFHSMGARGSNGMGLTHRNGPPSPTLGYRPGVPRSDFGSGRSNREGNGGKTEFNNEPRHPLFQEITGEGNGGRTEFNNEPRHPLFQEITASAIFRIKSCLNVSRRACVTNVRDPSILSNNGRTVNCVLCYWTRTMKRKGMQMWWK